MRRFDPSTSLLAGMSEADLRAELAALQQAYLQLGRGQQVVTASYTQGDGAKSVTYRQTDLATLAALIRQLQAQLGIVDSPRRAVGVKF